MKKMWTSISAAVVLVACVLVVSLAPTSYVLWSAGPAVNLVDAATGAPPLTVEGRDVTRAHGGLFATSLSQSGPTDAVTLPQIIGDYFLPDHSVLPRDAVYASVNLSLQPAASATVSSSMDTALAAGARQAGIDVKDYPIVTAVRQKSPANQVLLPADLIIAIDDKPMATADQVREYIRGRQVGDQSVVTVLRAGEKRVVTIDALVGSPTNGTVPSMGITVGTGYLYSPALDTNGVDAAFAGSAQGLAMALASYELLTDRDDLAGRAVAAVGQVSFGGEVSPVSAINEHVASARDAQADLVIIPRTNCSDLMDPTPDIPIVAVRSLAEAIAVLDGGAGEQILPTC
ncbi:MAG: PDZ domain-containing protein [Propionibacteriaceae bacterium]|jgi:PDZ domain-containing protein|nr:PDZ domain-containing protein [Propionibacteriaceae bacterium]